GTLRFAETGQLRAPPPAGSGHRGRRLRQDPGCSRAPPARARAAPAVRGSAALAAAGHARQCANLVVDLPLRGRPPSRRTSGAGVGRTGPTCARATPGSDTRSPAAREARAAETRHEAAAAEARNEAVTRQARSATEGERGAAPFPVSAADR